MRFGRPYLYILLGAMCAGKALHWFLAPEAWTSFGFSHVAVAVQAIAGACLFGVGVQQLRRTVESPVARAN